MKLSKTRMLRDTVCAFGRDRAGNFGMLAALLSLPLLGAVGLAIDYSTMSRTRVQLQQAVDAAVLAVAQRGADISKSEARRIAENYMSGNLAGIYRNLDVSREGTRVTLKAETDASLAFGGLFGLTNQPINAIASADIAYSTYEVALVLDTTGSMRGGKLQSMKDAVIGLVDDLSGQVSDPERLKFALVPFSSFVNVGPQYGPKFDDKGKIIKGTGAEWLDLHGKADTPQVELSKNVSRFELFHQLGQEWKGCVETRYPSKKGDHDVADTPADKSDKNSYFVPAFAIDEPDDINWGGRPVYTNSYLQSPADPLSKDPEHKEGKLKKYGITNAAEIAAGTSTETGDGAPAAGVEYGPVPGPKNFSRGKGPNNNCFAQPIIPLSNSYAGIKSKVRAFEANGNTNIMEGVAWGFRVLSPGEPFSQGKDDKNDPRIEKIMVVLSDGANVFGNRGVKLGSSYSSFGYLVDGRLGISAGGAKATNTKMNEKTLQACQNAKDEGIEVYTIRLEEPDVATGMMLQECASSPGHFFDAPSRSQLDAVFEKIGDGIVKLRISS
ncbi:vWA domain-containing protein [Nitratireductor luteus]|uniref:vWA domain-containing protein n=1 Tax=Nitratireductor luteus TaxID=2976980 RepID=UPI00223F9EE5|nr:vWA domain-containing protein [Nitratireductor luteus]